MPTTTEESVLEKLERYAQQELDTLKFDEEAKHNVWEDIAKIENQLDEFLTAALLLKRGRSKAERATAQAALTQYMIAAYELGVKIHDASGINTMRFVCCRLSDRHPKSSNARVARVARFARMNFIDGAWNGVGNDAAGYWRA